MIGTNFQPQPLDPSGGALQKKPSADAGVQEAIKVLSLRLPKVVGAQSMAPGALLNAQGARGDSRIDAIVNRVLQQYLPTEKPPMGQAPTVPPVLGQPGPGESGPMPPSPPVRMPDPSAPIPPQTPLADFMPQRPRVVPGAETGQVPVKGPTSDDGVDMIGPQPVKGPTSDRDTNMIGPPPEDLPPSGEDPLITRLRRKYMGSGF